MKSKACLKCGYERVESDIEVAQEHTCPSCGIVYAKFEASLLTAEEDKEPSLEDKMKEIRERKPSASKTLRQESRISPWKGELVSRNMLWKMLRVVFYAYIGMISLALTKFAVDSSLWGLVPAFIFLPFGLVCLRKAFRTYYSESVLPQADNTLEKIDVYFDGVLPEIGEVTGAIILLLIIIATAVNLFSSSSSSGSKEKSEVSYSDAVWIGKTAVRNVLKNSDSAMFRSIEYVKNGGGGFVCGEVNSKNSFGGFSGWQHFIAVGTQTVYLEEQVSGFRNVWRDVCLGKAW